MIAPVRINSFNKNILCIQAYCSNSNLLILYLVPAISDEISFKNSKIVWTGGCLDVVESIQLKNRCNQPKQQQTS